MSSNIEQKKIVLVDDNISNLTIGKNALIETYNVYTVPSGKKLMLLLEKILPDLILLDVEMPEMSGYEAIRELKANSRTSKIPVIFLTGHTDMKNELEGLSLGAVDYITKPFSPPLLLKRIEIHLLVTEQKKKLEQQQEELKRFNDNLMDMVKNKTKTILELQNATLHAIADLVECRDGITGGHITRTQAYLKILIDAMLDNHVYVDQVKKWDIPLFIQSAQLHDVGKISISDTILLKPGKLTQEEFEQMKLHTLIGADIINKIGTSTTEKLFLSYALVLAKTHHERWDGKGYPEGLAKEEIPLEGRIMAIADVYDALISKRPYKEAISHETALEIIVEGKGTQFDPLLVELFQKTANQFHEAAKNWDIPHK